MAVLVAVAPTGPAFAVDDDDRPDDPTDPTGCAAVQFGLSVSTFSLAVGSSTRSACSRRRARGPAPERPWRTRSACPSFRGRASPF